MVLKMQAKLLVATPALDTTAEESRNARSTDHEGLILPNLGHALLWIWERFSAARQLHCPAGLQCWKLQHRRSSVHLADSQQIAHRVWGGHLKCTMTIKAW